jgi:hypothetical protein
MIRKRVRMKLIFFIALMIAVPSFARGQAANDEGKKELLKTEREFTQAVVRNDLAAIERLVSGDWTIVDADGNVITKERFVGIIKSGALTHESIELSDQDVRLYGDAAVVTGFAVSKGKFMGQEFSAYERSTDFFVRKDGHWQCVFTQLTRINKK